MSYGPSTNYFRINNNGQNNSITLTPIGTSDLGSSSINWNNLYTKNAFITNAPTLPTVTSLVTLTTGGQIAAASSISPSLVNLGGVGVQNRFVLTDSSGVLTTLAGFSYNSSTQAFSLGGSTTGTNMIINNSGSNPTLNILNNIGDTILTIDGVNNSSSIINIGNNATSSINMNGLGSPGSINILANSGVNYIQLLKQSNPGSSSTIAVGGTASGSIPGSIKIFGGSSFTPYVAINSLGVGSTFKGLQNVLSALDFSSTDNSIPGPVIYHNTALSNGLVLGYWNTSNVVSPSVVPAGGNNTGNIGTNALGWKDIFSGGIIYFGGNISPGTNNALVGPNSATKRALGNAWNVYSSIKYKENIQDLTSGIDTVMKLRPVSYTWIKGQGDNIQNEDGSPATPEVNFGFIAQEVQKILPQIVNLDENGDGGMDYTKIIVWCVKAIQEQQQIIQNQQQIIQNIQDRLQN